MNFVKKFFLTVLFIGIILSNMILMDAPFPWAWIPIGIDIILIVLAIITTIVCIYKSDDKPKNSNPLNQPNFGPKPKTKKQKRGKKNASKR